MKRDSLLRPLLLFSGCCALAWLARVPSEKPLAAATLLGAIDRVHDPSRILECDGKYYFYRTGNKLPAQVSSDMITWQSAPPVLSAVPDWMHRAVPAAKGDTIWAPDVVLWRGKYRMFYSYSTFGSKTSAIGLLTGETLDPQSPKYGWKDEGLVIATNQQSDFNAIDPAPAIDANGDLFLSLGSWNAGGIKVVKLDENCKPQGEPKTIAAGQENGPEAPYLHLRNGVWTLFANHETCCAGMNSTYRVVMGQSKSVFGPFLDQNGRDMARGGGTLFLETDGARIGPGHIGIIAQNGLDRVTFHYYDGQNTGTPTLGMQTLWWDEDGWPRAGNDVRGGRYILESKASGLALGVQNNARGDGTALDQAKFQGAAQSWNIAPTGDGFYSIRSTGTGKFMNLDGCSALDGAKISQSPWNKNSCQRWRIEQTGAESYRIASQSGKTALTLPGDGKAPLLQAAASSWKGAAAQNWTLRALP